MESRRDLYRDAYLAFTLDEPTGVVRYIRSAAPYPSIEAVRATHDGLRKAMPSLVGRGLVVLIDVRQAPPRNDDAFEAEIGKLLKDLAPLFRASATVVATAVGRLQAKRVANARGRRGQVFTEEKEAVAWLLGCGVGKG